VSKRDNRARQGSLALAIAAGRTVAAWAQDNQVPRRTAYRWARSREVLQLVQQIRRRAIDRAIGTLARHATAAAEEIGRISTKGETDAIKLAASRAVLADLMTVSNYATLEARVAALEDRVHAPVIRDLPPA
jgi:hypothetical protein